MKNWDGGLSLVQSLVLVLVLVLDRLRGRSLSGSCRATGPVFLYHSGGLADPPPSSGLLAEERRLTGGDSGVGAEPEVVAGEAATGVRVRWTWETWPGRAGDSGADRAAASSASSADPRPGNPR